MGNAQAKQQEEEIRKVLADDIHKTGQYAPVKVGTEYKYYIPFSEKEIREYEKVYRKIEKRNKGNWGNKEQVSKFADILGIISFEYAEKLFIAFANINKMKSYNTIEVQDKIIRIIEHRDTPSKQEPNAAKNSNVKSKNEMLSSDDKRLTLTNFLLGLSFVINKKGIELTPIMEIKEADVKNFIANAGRKADFLFNFMDDDGSGTVDAVEIKNVLELSIGKGSKVRVPKTTLNNIASRTVNNSAENETEIDFSRFIIRAIQNPMLISSVNIKDPIKSK